MSSKSSIKKKLDSAGISPRLGQPSDAVHLQTNSVPVAGTIEAYHDDFSDDGSDSSLSFVAGTDQQDPPPLYTDDPDSASINPLLPSSSQTLPGGLHAPVPKRTDSEGNETYVDKRLDTDPTYLEHTITHLALFPPRPYARVLGTHTESEVRSSSNGRSESRSESRVVTDFDVRVDLTPFLYHNINRQEAWRTLRTVGNFDKVCRGTVFATRAPGYGGSGQRATGEEGTPSMREWCHRYCASHRRLKSMLIRRRVTGFDEERLRAKLINLVRATQYRGQLEVSFPVHGERVEVSSDVWENRWRNTTWIRWLFYLTFLWIFTWPYLVLRTICFEVITIDWAFSRPKNSDQLLVDDPTRPPREGVPREFVTISEDAWYNMWARAIQRAVLERRVATLDQSDLRDAETMGPTFAEGLGQAGDLIRAGMNAMNAVNRQFGWGHNR